VNEGAVKVSKKSKPNRYSISVSGKIYDRLQAKVPRGRVACVVDDYLSRALDDPEILNRLLVQCLRDDGALS
jgi:hypothetical protein